LKGPRIKHSNRQTFETLINEEALLFAKYLRDERKPWIREKRRKGMGSKNPDNQHD